MSHTVRVRRTAKEAVDRSISFNEVVALRTDETKIGTEARIRAAIESLRPFGLEFSDWRLDYDAVDCHGSHLGLGWHVTVFDCVNGSPPSWLVEGK